MIAAMSKKGYLAAHIIPGSVDSFGFFDFIVEDVVSTKTSRILASNYLSMHRFHR